MSSIRKCFCFSAVENSLLASNEVYDIYKNICEANEVSAISHSVFGRELLACFPEVKKFRKRILGGNNELKYPFNLNNNFIQTDKDTNTRIHIEYNTSIYFTSYPRFSINI